MVTMLAGWFIAQHVFNWYSAPCIIVLAELISDTIYYALGRWGGERIRKKYAFFIEPTSTKSKYLKRLFVEHPRKTLVIGKLTHIAGVPVLLAAGAAKISWGLFLIFDLFATIPKSLFFVLIGFYLGNMAGSINHYLAYGTVIVSGLIATVFIAYMFFGIYVEKKLLGKNL